MTISQREFDQARAAQDHRVTQLLQDLHKADQVITRLHNELLECRKSEEKLRAKVARLQDEAGAAGRQAQGRLCGLQRQGKRIQELEQELARERAINDALLRANDNGWRELVAARQNTNNGPFDGGHHHG